MRVTSWCGIASVVTPDEKDDEMSNTEDKVKKAAQPMHSADAEAGSKVQGEGDYESARRYNEATKDFVDAGRVDEAVKQAAPKTKREADELEASEKAGRDRSKGEDPAVERP